MTFDLEAARAKRREAAKEPFEYSVNGDTYQVPNQIEWPITVVDLFSQGKVKDAFEALVGKDGFPASMTMGDVNDVMTAAAEFFGLGDLGNS